MYFIDIEQLEFIALDLRLLLLTVAEIFGYQVITSMYRIGDVGVHGSLPLRAVDIRCRDEALGELIVSWINERWQYDTARPDMKVAIAHGNGSNYHIHIQVHPNTVVNKFDGLRKDS